MTIEELSSAFFKPRKIQSRGLVEIDDWRLKLYCVVQDGSFDPRRFAGHEDVAKAFLPQPATDEFRPGVGIIIMHQATAGDYLVTCWWDNQNELPIRVAVSLPGEAQFRTAGERESICAWDLDIIIHERDAFVRSTSTTGLNMAKYLADRLSDLAD